MFRKFKFEESIYGNLPGIPCSTRYKLESVGVRLEESLWRKLPLEERNILCHLSVRSQGERDAYREFLLLAVRRSGEEPELSGNAGFESEKAQWENPGRIPISVVESSFGAGLPLRPEDWLRFDDLERYVLFRVTREKPEVLAEVLREFLRSGRYRNGPTAKAASGL